MPDRRGAIVQRARVDIWISDRVFEESPTSMTRLLDDRGWSTVGGFDTWGKATAWVMRSATICRARIRSVPGSKIRSIVDSPGDDSDRMVCIHGVPLSKSCSIGVVI